MCLTPTISLSTAVTEFSVATFVLFYYRKSRLSKVIVIFLYLLGLYQFTEYMICTSDPVLWAKIGFVIYTFLPAVGLKFCLDHVKKKCNNLSVFAIPIVFSLLALLKENFIIESTCGRYFITVRHLFSDTLGILPDVIYAVYYIGFILLASYLLIKHYKKEKNVLGKGIDIALLVGIFISLIPAGILLFILPALSLSKNFASIYCQFAVVFAIAVLIAFHLDKKSHAK